VFPSRAFRHNSIYIRTDRGIARPEDLKGRRIGVPEYQVTANVWTRAVLEDEHGVKPSDVTWVRGGYEQAGRIEKIAVTLPPDVRVEDAPAGATISGMLAAGEIDAVIGPRAPSCFINGHRNVGWLYPDPADAASAWFRKTGIFPIMHAVGVRRDVLEKHPWLAQSIYKAFAQAKRLADAEFAETTALKIGLPWVNAEYDDTRALMGDDFWSYGLNDANRKTLNAMARYSYEQGLAVRLLTVEEMFAESTIGGETRV
jgi:4,5-dihydroxyphthalate decarboxylase